MNDLYPSQMLRDFLLSELEKAREKRDAYAKRIGEAEGAIETMHRLVDLAASHLATIRGETIELREALTKCVEFIEAANTAEIEGFIPRYDDVELTADGSYKLSDARRALASPIVAKRSGEGDKGE